MLVILSISTYRSLFHIRTYAAHVSMILKSVGFIVIMLLSLQFSLSLYKTVLVSKRALRFQRALSVRTFSLCTWRRWEAVSGAWSQSTRFSAIHVHIHAVAYSGKWDSRVF